MKSKHISQRAYAAHRGCSLSSVQLAIKTGRLKLSIEDDEKGHAKILNAEVADREWAANTRSVGNPGISASPLTDDIDDDQIDYSEAKRRREIEEWRKAKIKRQVEDLALAQRRGDLIETAAARSQVLDEYASIKAKLLGLPTRARQRLPHLTASDVAVIDGLVRQALEALSDG